MYAIQTLVGQKYGGYLNGTARFRTEAEADQEIQQYRKDERKADATVMKRRVVRV